MDTIETSRSRLLKPDEAAAVLSAGKKALEDWRRKGGGPRYCKIGKAVRYRIEDLEAFIQASMRDSTARK